jgi:hypothetical protein
MADASSVHRRAEARLHEHARRVIPPGSFVLPLDVAFILGAGDGEVGESIFSRMFAGGRFNPQFARILPPEVVRDVGQGSISAGRKVLEKFVANLRARQEPDAAKETAEPQAYARGGAAKMTKEAAGYRDAIEDGKFCALCDMFVEPHGCTLVEGKISRTGLCDHYEKS